MRIRFLAVFLTVIFLPLSFGLAQTTASLDSIPARMHDVIVANEVPGAVTVVATRDSVLRMDAQGWADPEHKSFMRVDWLSEGNFQIGRHSWKSLEMPLQRRPSRSRLTLHDVNSQARERRFFVASLHVPPGLIHGADDLV